MEGVQEPPFPTGPVQTHFPVGFRLARDTALQRSSREAMMNESRTYALMMGIVFVGACSFQMNGTPEGETARNEDAPEADKPDAGATENAGDSGTPATGCGDKTCAGAETCTSCAIDCGVCPTNGHWVRTDGHDTASGANDS